MTVDDTEGRRGFVSRWAQRKAQARHGAAPEPRLAPELAGVPLPNAGDAASGVQMANVPGAPETMPGEPARGPVPVAEALPTLADVAALTRASDYSRFVAPGVDEGVKHAAMKRLFADPHFNVMDGLDTYIDDYGKPDPIPLALLRKMNQSKFLGLFDDEVEDPDAASLTTLTPTESLNPPDDHADLQLQQDDAVGQPGPAQGTGA
jgi:hypothetical protein